MKILQMYYESRIQNLCLKLNVYNDDWNLGDSVTDDHYGPNGFYFGYSISFQVKTFCFLIMKTMSEQNTNTFFYE